ncbi:hypothetical protein [Nostoc sp. 'Peltigera membranacea cyanobiont' 232]|uniref:hypothetical protein n=1 Tax=Nostoc sp. 'Peltigera membranacea cyanobiont' 232 TaxID=2014531 RepID=UPI001CB97B79|nr:hypothetical protein [Nostoc sp. 'Peltigera membranacea cyanobiont' 232]
MTATITKPKLKKAASKPQSPYKRLHVIIPIEDMLWASQQKPSVTQLWQECWTADPYGSRWMPLTSALGYSTFISAKKILSDSGLFIFKPDKSIQDGRETASWMVKNLHGSRMKEFWEKANSVSRELDAEKREPDAEISEIDAGCEEMRASYKASILAKDQSEQGFQKPSRTVQEQLTNSSKEFVSCVSDTLPGNLREEETAHAPLGGASPQSVQSVSEKEEDSPTANDCTSLALVDAAQSNPASLLAENQDCGVEAIFPHEGTGSAASVVVNEFFSTLAIANQTQGQVEQGYSASLPEENQVSGVEVKAAHEGEASAAPVTEKWSHEAIVARSNMRPVRREKLNQAANSSENPGFDFLQECWQDDPALQIVIKKLVAKFPQWGIAIVDGVLVDCNGSCL